MNPTKIIYLFVLPFLLNTGVFSQNNINKPLTYTWDLSDIYCHDSCWEFDFHKLTQAANRYSLFLNSPKQDQDWLYNYLSFNDTIRMTVDKLYNYATLRRDVNQNDSLAPGMIARISELDAKINSNRVAINSLILSKDNKLLISWFEDNSKLQQYLFFFSNLIRQNDHSLKDIKEEILSLTQPLTQIPFNTFLSLTNVFDNLYNNFTDTTAFNDHITTFASILSGNVLINKFYAQIRHFNNSLEASLFQENISTDVYTNLINSVKKNTKPLQDWVDYKSIKLGLTSIPHDIYSKRLSNMIQDTFSFEQALTIQKECLSFLGPDILKILDSAKYNNWYDVYPTKNKRQDSYACYYIKGHPYILLNWRDNFSSLSTFMHESGHLINIQLTIQKQPITYSTIPTFNAEIASKVNEILLLEYLIKKADTKEKKLFLTEQYIRTISSSFYLQSLFADFEKTIHDLSENGQSLTYDIFTDLNTRLFSEYYGPKLQLDGFVKNSWAMIPHYYYNFYVYSYVLGLTTAFYYIDLIHTQGQKGVDSYLAFLSSGNNDYPINVLKQNGVDVSSEKLVEPIVKKMGELVELYKQLDK